MLSVQVIDKKNGLIKTIPSSQINLGYRKSDLHKDYIYLSASFKGKKKKKEIENEINFLKKKKNISQPSKIKTGGSTFKNLKINLLKKFGH